MAIPKDQWEWYGIPGHYILGHRCLFRLFTVVGDYVVSTVGELMASLRNPYPTEKVNCDTKWETMVFKAGRRCQEKGCGCNAPSLATTVELEVRRYKTRGAAQAGHMAMCERWAGMGEGK